MLFKPAIAHLSPAQACALSEYYEKWKRIGLATGPINQRAAEYCARVLFKHLKWPYRVQGPAGMVPS